MMAIKPLLTKYFFIMLLIILSVSYFCFGTYRNWPYKVESDGKYYYQYLVSGLYDHDFDFSNNYRANKYDWMLTEIDHYNLRNDINSTTGKPTNPFTVGPAILWTPFFIIAILIGKFLNVFVDIDLNPFGLYLQYATMFSGIFYTLAGLYTLHRLLIRYYAKTFSKLTLWIMLFMTPLYYYTIFEPSISHIYDFFTYVLLIYLFIECCSTKSNWLFAALGCVSALHVLVRSQNMVTILLFSCVLIIKLVKSQGITTSSFKNFTIYCLVLIIGLSPLPLINNYLYGSPFAVPQGSGFLHWGNPQIIQLLFSGRNGLFSHHPLIMLGLIGYLYFLYKNKNNSHLFYLLLIVFCIQVYINSTVDDWWSGHSFGQRRLLSSIPIFAFGLCYLIERLSSNYESFYRKYITVLVSICTFLFIYLTMIHVFIWDYNKPHNIVLWMIYYAPKVIFQNIFT